MTPPARPRSDLHPFSTQSSSAQRIAGPSVTLDDIGAEAFDWIDSLAANGYAGRR